MHIIVNGVDNCSDLILGLRGNVGFSYIKDLKIKGFRIYDLTGCQYAMQISRFEDVIIEDVIIKNCYDLNQEKTVGYFCRMLAGGWIDWKKGMKVQQSDAVVSNGKIYRVKMEPDATLYESVTRPDFENGTKVLDGITWVMTQEIFTYTGGARNVIFRNIQLEKPRVPFSIEFNKGRYNRSYYPGAEMPVQENIILDNIKVLFDKDIPLVQVSSPVNMITIANSRLKNRVFKFYGNEVYPEYLRKNTITEFYKTSINIYGCIFDHEGEMILLENSGKGKEIELKTASNMEPGENFSAKVIDGGGKISVQSDLPGLIKPE